MTKELKFFFIAFILSLPFWWGINVFQGNLEKFFYAEISQPLQEINLVMVNPKPKKPSLNLEAKSAISLKINQFGKEKVLFAQNSSSILPIASLTKFMTALIVLEDPENYDFSKTITISREAALKDDVPEYGNLKTGEKKKIEELLNLMLVYSSNDAAFALSEVIGVDNFVERMNKKARVLGLSNTHFVNPTGLDPENITFSQETTYFFNYSTAEDLARLSKYILNEFPIILEISSNQHKFSDLSLNQNIIGGKTGYTDEAGGCIILVSENNGNYFINVILGTKTVETRIREMQKLINWLGI